MSTAKDKMAETTLSVQEGKPTTRYRIDAGKLTFFRSEGRVGFLPDGISSISKDAFKDWASAFPKGLWQIRFAAGTQHIAFSDLLDGDFRGQIVLPPEYLRNNPGKSGRDEDRVTVNSLIVKYLTMSAEKATLAERLFSSEDVGLGAKAMLESLRARLHAGKAIGRKVWSRAVTFFVRHAEDIQPQTADEFVQILPESLVEPKNRRRPASRPTGEAYHPALLDAVLRILGINPGQMAFRRVEQACVHAYADPVDVKTAVVPYLAEGLSMEISAGYDTAIYRARFLRSADLAAEQLSRASLVGAIQTVFSVHGRMIPEAMPALGRYGSLMELENLSQDLNADALETRSEILACLGLLLSNDLMVQGQILQGKGLGSLLLPYIRMRLHAGWLSGVPQGCTVSESGTLVRSVNTPKLKTDCEVRSGLDFRGRADHTGRMLTRDGFIDVMSKQMAALVGDGAPASVLDEGYMSLSLCAWTGFLAINTHQFLVLDYIECNSYDANAVRTMLCDPFWRLATQNIVFIQDGRSFVSAPSGPIDVHGEPYKFGIESVHIASVQEMTGEEVDAWLRYFADHKTTSWMGQMEEPCYPADGDYHKRLHGYVVRDAQLRTRNSTGVIYARRGGLYARSDGIQLRFFRGTGHIRIDDLKVLYIDREVNRLLYELDVATAEQRAAKDDVTLLPFIERMSATKLRKLQKSLTSAEAPKVKAAVMSRLNELGGKSSGTSRFSLSI